MNKKISFGEYIRKLRESRNLPLREVAEVLKIDVSTLSKIERNERSANKDMIEQLAALFSVNAKELQICFLSDKVVYEIVNEEFAIEALKVAERKVEYYKQHKEIANINKQ